MGILSSIHLDKKKSLGFFRVRFLVEMFFQRFFGLRAFFSECLFSHGFSVSSFLVKLLGRQFS